MARIINKKNEPIVFYYNSDKGKIALRMKPGDSIEVDDFISVSDMSNTYIANKWVHVIVEDTQANSFIVLDNKMKQASKNVELYMNYTEH